MTRLDTTLEAEAAEFMVLGRLLLERVEAHKAYTRYPGFDVIAVDPEKNRQARIQVKSRFPTNANKFLIKKIDCDFVVFAKLNRTRGKPEPQFFVFPADVVRKASRGGKWGEVFLRDIERLEDHENAWHLIVDWLRA